MTSQPEFSEIGIRPFIESPWYQEQPPWPWTIAPIPPLEMLWLHGDNTDEEVGSVLAALARPVNATLEMSDFLVFHQLIGLERLTAQGGLAVLKAGQVVISPGCCFGLEDWREWQRAIANERTPWLGHDPSPWIDFSDGAVVRIWADEGTHADHVELTRGQLQQGIESAHRDLQDFLGRFESWLRDRDYRETDRLVELFDRSFAIT